MSELYNQPRQPKPRKPGAGRKAKFGPTYPVYWRMPIAAESYLERGIALHGSQQAAILHAVVKAYPEIQNQTHTPNENSI